MAKNDVLKKSRRQSRDWLDEEIADEFIDEIGFELDRYALCRALSGYNGWFY